MIHKPWTVVLRETIQSCTRAHLLERILCDLRLVPVYVVANWHAPDLLLRLAILSPRH